ncbi:MAG: MBL fold metallo-hydrolase [Anaerolineae bacterium]|nr:MBL fold metallo-hydrolase [Anaerolineae bacterium]
MLGNVYRLQSGGTRLLIVCDADQRRSIPDIFPSAPADELVAAIRAEGVDPLSAPFSQNILCIQAGDNTILVDTGLGAPASHLPEHLRAEGIAPESVNHVIITHGHGDHVGGIADAEGALTFPNARYYCWKSEWDYNMEQVPQLDAAHPLRRSLPRIEERVRLLDAESEFLPGIRALAAPGHSIGHMALRITLGELDLLHIVDAAHIPAQVAHPEWSPRFDYQPDQAAQTRTALFRQAEVDDLLVLAYHFPWPGLGHVYREGSALRWQPLLD